MTETPQYKPGDTANGHILGEDNQWHPIPVETAEENVEQEPDGTEQPAPGNRHAWLIVAAVVAVLSALLMISIIGSGDTQTTATTPSPTASPVKPWGMLDDDGDGILNGSDPQPDIARPDLCKEFDSGSVITVNAQSAKELVDAARILVTTACPEHLAAFDATTTPPPPPGKEAYAPIGERDWALLVKNPDAYVGQRFVIYAEVSQFDAATGPTAFRAQGSYAQQEYWFSNGDNIIVSGSEGLLGGIVEDDTLKMWVTVDGSQSYDTQIGGSTTVPKFTADYIDIIG